jgi:hypothetical protein
MIVPELAGAARARGGWIWERYSLIDRGSYEIARSVIEPELAEVAARAASRFANRELRLGATHALRLSAGDYLLAHHDTVYADYPIEVMFDLSPREVRGAEAHYRRRGKVFFRFPSQPGAASIVERGPTVTCNHTYVSKLDAGATVVRLVVLLW